MTASKGSSQDSTARQLEALRRRLEELEQAAGEIRAHLDSLSSSALEDQGEAGIFDAVEEVEPPGVEALPPEVFEPAVVARESEILSSMTETEIEESLRPFGDPIETPPVRVCTTDEIGGEASDEVISPSPMESDPVIDVAAPSESSRGSIPGDRGVGNVSETVPSVDEETGPVSDVAWSPAPVPASSARVRNKKFEADLEMRIGSVWLNRLGLVALLISFALLAKYASPRLMPWHKVLFSYLVSGALSGVGWFLRDRLSAFARPVMAGGIALAFFTGYGAHFLGPMACISVWTSLLLMSAAIVALFVCAELWRSEPTAGLAIFLGHVAAFVSGGEAGLTSVVAIFILSVTALVFFIRQEWIPLGLFAVVAAFVSHFLWVLQAPFSGTASDTFWLNIVFLSSYYLIFLSSDLIYNHRLHSRGEEAFSSKQRAIGRAVGPTALLMYVTLTIWVFQQTGIYWDQLSLFLLPMAVIQAALVPMYRRYRNVDFRLYASVAVVFASLGLISWLDGLTLNLALAAEALLLLVLARVLNFWFLTPLAQIVLAVNFVHFWTSESRLISSWPAFLGAVATASVYFVKARLMETAGPAAEDAALPEGAGARFLRQLIDSQSERIAFLQVIAGSVLVFYQCNTFFDGSWRGLTMALLALPIVGCAIWLTSRPMMVATVLLFYGCLYQLGQADSNRVALWFVQQAVLCVMVVTGLLAVARSRSGFRPPLRLFGMVCMGMAAVGSWAYVGSGSPEFLWFPLWLAVPFAFWLETELWTDPGPGNQSHFLEGSEGVVDAKVHGFERHVRGVLPVVAAVLTCRAAWEVSPSESAALWFLSGATVLLSAATLWRRSRFLLLGLGLHLVVTVGLAALVAAAVTETGGLMWWMTTSTAGAGLVLVHFSKRARLGSLMSVGACALLLSVVFVFRLCALETSAFSMFALWLLPLLMVWVGVGLVWNSFQRGQRQDADWHDRLGLDTIGHDIKPLVVGFSLAVTGVQTLVVLRQLQVGPSAFVVLSILAAVLLAVSAIRPTPGFQTSMLAQLALNLGVLIFSVQSIDARPLLGWWVVAQPVVVALVLLAVFRWQRRGSTAISALVCLTMAALATSALALANSCGFSPLLLWIGSALAIWLGIEVMRAWFCSDDFSFEGWRDFFGGSLLGPTFEWSGVFVGAATSAMVFGLALRHFEDAEQTLWFLVASAPVLVIATVLRSSPALCAAVVGLLMSSCGLIMARAPVGIDAIVTWSLFSEAVLAAAVLVFVGNSQRRISLAFGGVLTLVCALAVGSALIVYSATFSPYSLWLFSIVGCWLVIEQMRSGVLATRGETGGPLRDQIGLDLVPLNSALIGVPSAVVGAALLIFATSMHFADDQTPVVLLMALSIVFAAATVLRRSVPCAVAAALLFGATHGLFHIKLGMSRAVSDFPLIGFALIVVSLAFAGGIEAWAARGGNRGGFWAWFPLVLGMIVGHLFLGRFAVQTFGYDAAALPAEMVLALLAVVYGWGFGLVRTTAAGVAGTAWVLFSLVVGSLTSGVDAGLFVAGLLIGVQVIVVERLSTSGRSLLPERVRGILQPTLVVASALALLYVLLMDNTVRGYWTTSGWSLVALTFVAVGFLFKNSTYRRTGLAVVGLTVLRVVFVDIAKAEPFYRIVAFMCLGVSLVTVSFLYSRFKEKINRWL